MTTTMTSARTKCLDIVLETMTNKISNSNKNHIHIHIGDKGKKKRRHRRKTASRGHGHGGTHVVTNHISVQPLFNRSQTLDSSLGDERERERIRIQRGIFESQTPVNNASFANAAPANDYDLFRGNMDRYFVERKKSKPTEPASIPSTPLPKREGPFMTPLKQVVHKKKIEEPEPVFKHKTPSVFPSVPHKGTTADAPPTAPFTSQVPPSSSAANVVQSDPVPLNQIPSLPKAEEPSSPSPSPSPPRAQPRGGPFTSTLPPRPGPFTSQVPENAAMDIQSESLRRTHGHFHGGHDDEQGKYKKQYRYENVVDARDHRSNAEHYRRNRTTNEADRKADAEFIALLNKNFK